MHCGGVVRSCAHWVVCLAPPHPTFLCCYMYDVCRPAPIAAINRKRGCSLVPWAATEILREYREPPAHRNNGQRSTARIRVRSEWRKHFSVYGKWPAMTSSHSKYGGICRSPLCWRPWLVVITHGAGSLERLIWIRRSKYFNIIWYTCLISETV